MDKVSWLRRNCIGRGSFGTVNLAADKSDGHLFAVKSVEMKSCSSKQLEALENEIRILKSLSSPYVVEYFGDDVTKESPTASFRNLHVEYLPGGTVAEITGADVDETTVRSYTWCIVSALRYLHARGIVHCDVKGRNVLVGPTPGSAKLADFGSAKELGYTAAAPRGSPLWMAPEVIRGEYQGPESDIWSLGCSVIEMITGKPAWEDRGADTLCLIGYSDELPAIPGELSEIGRDFLDKCLRRNPGERWSCNQLLQHPFLSSCSHPIMAVEWSPKCVLDRFDSNFSDEETDQGNSNSNSNSNVTQRITELAAKPGVIWESDGWVEVRNFATEEVVTEACSCGEEEEGANSSFHNTFTAEEEITGANFEYSDSTRTKWEYLETDGCPSSEGPNCKYNGSVGLEAGSSCRRGFGFSDLAVEMKKCGINNNNSCCNLKLLYDKDYKCNINVPCVMFYLRDSINILFNSWDYSSYLHVTNALAFLQWIEMHAMGI